MKKFIRSILLLCMPLLLLAYPLDAFISNNLKKTNDVFGEYEVWNDIYNNKINAEMVVYGSSRAWVEFNPKILEDSLNVKIYNFGIDGHNFWLQYLRHLEYIKHNKLPKEIILAVDIYSLQKRDNLYLHQQFLPYMLGNYNIEKYTKSYKGFRFFDYKIPLIRYFGESTVIKKAFKTSMSNKIITPFRINGYKGIDNKWTNEFELAKTKMKNYNAILDSASVELFDKFLLECNKKRINVYLVYTPEYIEGQKFINNREEIIQLFIKYAKKYDMTYLDYSKDSICYNKDYFYNATHLNKNGSEIFSKNLSSDLLKITRSF